MAADIRSLPPHPRRRPSGRRDLGPLHVRQNQHGRLETAGAYRNRNPLICILGGLSFYLLYRWDLAGGLRGTGNGAGRTAAFSSGARTAELKGISEDQIRRAGRWNQEQMVGCYLNSLPRKFMRTMAGHPPQIGYFEIRRAGVAPPEVLLSMIWPGLDRWRGRFGPGIEQENDLAAMGSTNLPFYLREVVLKKYPGSPVWNHPVFRHPAYAPFAQQLSDFILEEERQNQLAVLIQVMPVLADYLESIDARHEARTLRATEERLTVAQSSLFSNGFNFQVKAAMATTATAAAAVVDVVGQGGRGEGSRFVSAQSSIVDSRDTSPTATDMIMVKPEPPPRHHMRSGASGRLASGAPAIADLDSRWGSRWRAGRQPELQWYSLRLEVIKEIRKVAKAHRCSEDAAMHIVNLQQQ
ncbi:centromere DNA-binding protein complex CBF3 subunit, domain 2 domain-containing protein [Hirsutella rhossiliensis]